MCITGIYEIDFVYNFLSIFICKFRILKVKKTTRRIHVDFLQKYVSKTHRMCVQSFNHLTTRDMIQWDGMGDIGILYLTIVDNVAMPK